ncbi:MAG: sulfite exporter TauE/SafE family protein [Spirochaetia bacterium]|nr:sulfite exporter TauE/SafE family protein [Spirochaetia bacterium]
MEILTDIWNFIDTHFHYWFMFPLAIFVSGTASASGFSGGVLFQPFYNLVLQIPVVNSVATGIATETIGTSSATIRYMMYKMVESPIGFTMIMLAIPGVVIGNHALVVINENILKILVGIVVLSIASIQIYSVIKNVFGTRKNVPIEDIYKVIWLPTVSGFFSATTGTGVAEMMQPTLEKGLNVATRRANATAIFVEAASDLCITILNLNAGLIRLDIFVFAAAGAFVGAQIGPYVSRFLPVRFTKVIFSIAISIVGVFYLYKGITWLMS